MRAVLEVAGIRDIRTKCVRSSNFCNVVIATCNGLKSLRTAEQVAAVRGKTVKEIPRLRSTKPMAEEKKTVAAEETAAEKATAKKPAAKKGPRQKAPAEKPPLKRHLRKNPQ